MRERFPHIESSLVKFGNANVDQFKYVLKGVSSGVCGPQAKHPGGRTGGRHGNRGLADG
jgi:hypothetical protein